MSLLSLQVAYPKNLKKPKMTKFLNYALTSQSGVNSSWSRNARKSFWSVLKRLKMSWGVFLHFKMFLFTIPLHYLFFFPLPVPTLNPNLGGIVGYLNLQAGPVWGEWEANQSIDRSSNSFIYWFSCDWLIDFRHLIMICIWIFFPHLNS